MQHKNIGKTLNHSKKRDSRYEINVHIAVYEICRNVFRSDMRFILINSNRGHRKTTTTKNDEDN